MQNKDLDAIETCCAYILKLQHSWTNVGIKLQSTVFILMFTENTC